MNLYGLEVCRSITLVLSTLQENERLVWTQLKTTNSVGGDFFSEIKKLLFSIIFSNLTWQIYVPQGQIRWNWLFWVTLICFSKKILVKLWIRQNWLFWVNLGHFSGKRLGVVNWVKFWVNLSCFGGKKIGKVVIWLKLAVLSQSELLQWKKIGKIVN